jgi:cytochrome c5
MKRVELTVLACVAIAATAAIGQRSARPQKSQPAAVKPAPSADAERGQWVFEHNCGRCHGAPEGLPTNVSGTVVKHMRVRANLNGADTQALLKFLHP